MTGNLRLCVLQEQQDSCSMKAYISEDYDNYTVNKTDIASYV